MSVPVKLVLGDHHVANLEALHKSIREEAFNVMQVTLPTKVGYLSDRIVKIRSDADRMFGKTGIKQAYADVDVEVHGAADGVAGQAQNKKRKLAAAAKADDGEDGSPASDAAVFTGKVNANEYFINAHEALRIEWATMYDVMDKIKLFINLNYPKIEDGDTFGQSVQEEVLNEVLRSQDSANQAMAAPLSYHTTRGDLAAKLVRFPGVKDYELALKEHDRRAIERLVHQFHDLRNIYFVVLDILQKNMEKIAKPKSGNSMGNYG